MGEGQGRGKRSRLASRKINTKHFCGIAPWYREYKGGDCQFAWQGKMCHLGAAQDGFSCCVLNRGWLRKIFPVRRNSMGRVLEVETRWPSLK